MFCSNCGAKIQDGTKFCPNCGALVAAAVQEKAENAVSDAVEKTETAAAEAQAELNEAVSAYSAETDEAHQRAEAAKKEAEKIEEEAKAAIALATAKAEEARAKADAAIKEAQEKARAEAMAKAQALAEEAITAANTTIQAAEEANAAQKTVEAEALEAHAKAQEAIERAEALGVTGLSALMNVPVPERVVTEAAPAPEAAQAAEPVKEAPADDKNAGYLRPWTYFFLQILYSIPVIGFIFLIVHSFSKKRNLKNYALSYWCWLIVALIIFGILVLLFVIFRNSPFLTDAIQKVQDIYSKVIPS